MRIAVLAAAIGAIVTISPLRAQDLRIGINAGTSSFAFRVHQPGAEESSLTRLAIGVHAGYRLTRALELETGLSWIRKASDGTMQGFEEPFRTNVQMDYLQIPALVRLTVPLGAVVRPVVVAGPALSIEVRCQDRRDVTELPTSHINCDATDRNRSDWSGLVGGGFAFGAGATEIALEDRYEFGFRDLDDFNVTETKSRGFTVTARLSRIVR